MDYSEDYPGSNGLTGTTTQHQLTEAEVEAILTEGDHAEALLASEAFQRVIEDLLKSIELQTFQSNLDEHQLRQDLYHQHVALQSIKSLLEHKVNQAAILRDNLNSPPPHDLY